MLLFVCQHNSNIMNNELGGRRTRKKWQGGLKANKDTKVICLRFIRASRIIEAERLPKPLRKLHRSSRGLSCPLIMAKYLGHRCSCFGGRHSNTGSRHVDLGRRRKGLGHRHNDVGHSYRGLDREKRSLRVTNALEGKVWARLSMDHKTLCPWTAEYREILSSVHKPFKQWDSM